MAKEILTILLVLFSVCACAVQSAENICSLSKNLICSPNTTIAYIGNLGDQYKVYRYTYTFNNGNRAANRIVFIDSQGVLSGIYATDASIAKIEDSCVLFKVPQVEGNSICLINGKLPKKAWVDGYNLALFL